MFDSTETNSFRQVLKAKISLDKKQLLKRDEVYSHRWGEEISIRIGNLTGPVKQSLVFDPDKHHGLLNSVLTSIVYISPIRPSAVSH